MKSDPLVSNPDMGSGERCGVHPGAADSRTSPRLPEDRFSDEAVFVGAFPHYQAAEYPRKKTRPQMGRVGNRPLTQCVKGEALATYPNTC